MKIRNIFQFAKKALSISLSIQLFSIYVLFMLIISWLIFQKAIVMIDEGVSQSAEEVMIDTANILAQSVQNNLNSENLDLNIGSLYSIKSLINGYTKRNPNAKIYDSIRNKVDMHFYITNKDGIVVFDSLDKLLGQDLSNWRDVHLTLKGKYGARSSAIDLNNINPEPNEKAFFIAAPIYSNQGKIIGSLTVYKAVENLNNFTEKHSNQLRKYIFLISIISILFATFIIYIFHKSISKLIDYAKELSAGKEICSLKMKQPEFQSLANSIYKIRGDLDGKEYVENYIHILAHEIKTPISGIRGAAEILQESLITKKEITIDRQKKFIDNILESSERLTKIIDRLLELASLEHKNSLDNKSKVNLKELLIQVVSSRESRLKNINIKLNLDNIYSNVDNILLFQAFANILDNAIDFSTNNSDIIISLATLNNEIIITIQDFGVGIPTYAEDKIFDRFFSLSRPNNKKGTGLGLKFVEKLIKLHNGSVSIKNNKGKGVIAIIKLQIKPL